MGLLDDAIRDHLELKRRHGADPIEVERIETEALSPARREAPASAEEPDLELAAAPEPTEDDEDALADLRPHDAEPDEDGVDEPDAPHHEPEPEAVYEIDPQATQAFSLDELEEQAARDAAAPGQPRPRERRPEAGEDDPADHDELEQTPEFLEETPEHDRLWFEQKPPKDFDF